MAASTDGKAKGDKNRHSLIPTTIKQLKNAPANPAGDNGYTIDGRELNQITIVGMILSADEQTNVRSAVAGIIASFVSDCVSNSIRVLKTTVQTSAEPISYVEAAQQIIEKEGVLGLFARGLGTRLLTNGIQASLFSVLWKLFEDMFANKGL